jgi:(S)-2-hydroxyglutarate dehydrogenase
LKRIIIVGGGIVGLATALKCITKIPNAKIIVLEKESVLAKHQTGNNSGVIHSGIYYKPGSLKATNCIRGYNELIQFCDENNIKYDLCGKLIVATNEHELPMLYSIYERGIANGLKGLEILNSQQSKIIEPHVSCIKSIRVPQTGIINYTDVTNKYAELFLQQGGTICFNETVQRVRNFKSEVIINTTKNEYSADLIVNCGGLYSDKIANMSDGETSKEVKIIPFRGEYYELNKEKEYLVKNLIYPVPNPEFPFLGVHFTRMIGGGIEAGPNAVLAFRREGYKKWDIDFSELLETLAFPGFRKIAFKYRKEGWMEMRRSFSKNLFVKSMQNLIPEIQESDVFRAGAGVRAQACDVNGGLLDDFKILDSKNIINVINAPSPAATSSLAIGESICNLISNKI